MRGTFVRMGGSGERVSSALDSVVARFAGMRARFGGARVPVVRRLSTLAAAAAILILGVPLISYYKLRTHAPEPESAAGDVALVSPRGDARVAQPVTLTWRRAWSAERYDVTVVGDDGTNVVRESTRDTTLLVRGLSPGRDYHWTVTVHLTDGGKRRSDPVAFRITAP